MKSFSACFIEDLSATIDGLQQNGDARGYAVYTPAGSEAELRGLLPEGFGLVLQSEGDLGDRLANGIADLLAAGHCGAVLINSDSPTLPHGILRAAVDAVLGGDRVVLSPAIDGGYTLIGLSKPHPELFIDMPWSTDAVFRLTMERARDIGLPAVVLDAWYDVDDAGSYAMLEAELDGHPPPFATTARPLQVAPSTRRFVRRRHALVAP